MNAIMCALALLFAEPPTRDECFAIDAVLRHQRVAITEMQAKHDRLKYILTETDELHFMDYMPEIRPYVVKGREMKKTWRLCMWDERKRLLADIEEVRSGQRIVMPSIDNNVRLGTFGTFAEKVEIDTIETEKRFIGKYAGRTISFQGWTLTEADTEGSSLQLLGIAEIKEDGERLIAKKFCETGEFLTLVKRYKQWLDIENKRIEN